jgi:hypothetical protein
LLPKMNVQLKWLECSSKFNMCMRLNMCMNNIKRPKDTCKLNFSASNSLPSLTYHSVLPFSLATRLPPSLRSLYSTLHGTLALLTLSFHFLHFWCFGIWDLADAAETASQCELFLGVVNNSPRSSSFKHKATNLEPRPATRQ